MEISFTLESEDNEEFMRALIREEVGSLLSSTLTGKAEILSQTELCRRLKISKSKLIEMKNRGLIPHMPFGSTSRYNLYDVIRALTTQNL